MMDIEANKPMERDTIFRIYSMTKPVAAIGVMLLCGDGRLELNAPASVYLPELDRLKIAEVACRLLTHQKAERVSELSEKVKPLVYTAILKE